jgi:hypothetical protein
MEFVKVLYNGNGEVSQNYTDRDDVLITNNFLNTSFGQPEDVVEYFIVDENGIQLQQTYDSKDYYTDGQINSGTTFSQILLDPERDVKNNGFNRGKTTIQYNFYRNLFNSSYQKRYWIKEISNSRLELKLTSQTISGDEMSQGLQSYQIYAAQKNYYSDFYLNFGNNDLVIAVNAAYILDQNDNNYLVIKLYEPLPLDFDVKSTLWIVDKLSESAAYEVDIQIEAESQVEENKLRGANFRIDVSDKVGQTTPYYSYDSLFSSPVSSSTQQLLSYYQDKALSINVNYASFDNFIHFSSATERINNFTYKLNLLEKYNRQIVSQSVISGNNTVISSSIQTIQNSIDNIINKFDIYEYYLYYASESFSWPKSTSTKPYSLYSVTSSQVLNWLGSANTLPTTNGVSILYSASYYDSTNKDILSAAAVPQYLLDDPSNQPYITFLDMIGQHFDNIWVYYKDVSNRYNATNNPDTGISLDLVSDALKGLGMQLYTNTNESDNVFYSLFGYNQDGSLLPPTGSEKNITYVTSSLSTLPYDQLSKEVYKRLYHNLPYLLKTKGTERGVKALISCYGIPESILFPMEFGGYDRTKEIGVLEWNKNKVTVISSSLELSQSVLSPYSTLQYYDNDNRKNINDVEVGFSPANTINSNISSSLGFFQIDQLIGNPADQYSSSYKPLDIYRDSYFTTYNKDHSISEYIRIIKFYNNSLFKMIKDFVPARSNVSTGIIIKPHILERSKYKRNEPEVIFSDYSQSIDTAFITASSANSYTISTATTGSYTTAIGYIPFENTFGAEKYTGEFQGTEFNARSQSIFDQSEISNNALNSTMSITRPANFQNVSNAVRSQKYLDLDYSSNAQVPVNFGIITQSIAQAQINNFLTINDPNRPYAQLQDFNYAIQRSTIPRYYGSRVESATYNVYTKGDKAYGNSPAIDHRTKKIALFTQIITSSLIPNTVNARLAYLVDNKSGLFELNQINNNWFEVQNTFKSGKTLTIKQFDNKKYSNQKSTDGIKSIYESGYSYAPMLYFNASKDNKIYFTSIDVGNYYMRATNYSSPNNYITGSGLGLQYPLIPSGSNSTGSIYNLFDNEDIDDYSAYTPGDSSSLVYSKYVVPSAGNYNINAQFRINITASLTNDSASFTLVIRKNGTTVGSQNVLFNSSGGGGGGSNPYAGNSFYVTWFDDAPIESGGGSGGSEA